jgi:exonuclease III
MSKIFHHRPGIMVQAYNSSYLGSKDQEDCGLRAAWVKSLQDCIVKQAGVVILIFDKLDFKPKLVRRDKEDHFILIKGAIHREEITVVNLYVLNVGAPDFIKHTLLDLKTQIDFNTVVVGDFNTPLAPIDRPSRQKINKETLELNDTVDLVDLTDIHRVFHPAIAQYTYFSAVHGTFSKINHILGHKASLNKYRKIEITPCIRPDHNTIKVELNNKRNSREYSNTWRLTSTLLHD